MAVCHRDSSRCDDEGDGGSLDVDDDNYCGNDDDPLPKGLAEILAVSVLLRVFWPRIEALRLIRLRSWRSFSPPLRAAVEGVQFCAPLDLITYRPHL